MKQLAIICTFLVLAFICEGQILKDSLYWATPAEREMYKSAIKKGRGQKALGSLIIVGGSALTTVGAGVAIAGIDGWGDDDDYYGDDIIDRDRLLWKGGSLLFLLGIGTILTGADMIKEGKQNVRTGKVCLKLNATSVGLVVNF